MQKTFFYSLALFLTPFIASAAQQDAQGFMTNFLLFINGTLIPFVLGIAFLLFAINAIRFFVVGGSSEEGKEKAKALAAYSLSAFVLILTFWGIINLLTSSVGFSGAAQPEQDYVKFKTTP